MKKALLVIAIAAFCGCKKEEPYNCGQAQADYFLLCQQRVTKTQELALASAQLRTATGQRREVLIAQIESYQSIKARVTGEMTKMRDEMRRKRCATNLPDDCLK